MIEALETALACLAVAGCICAPIALILGYLLLSDYAEYRNAKEDAKFELIRKWNEFKEKEKR